MEIRQKEIYFDLINNVAMKKNKANTLYLKFTFFKAWKVLESGLRHGNSWEMNICDKKF